MLTSEYSHLRIILVLIKHPPLSHPDHDIHEDVSGVPRRTTAAAYE